MTISFSLAEFSLIKFSINFTDNNFMELKKRMKKKF